MNLFFKQSPFLTDQTSRWLNFLLVMLLFIFFCRQLSPSLQHLCYQSMRQLYGYQQAYHLAQFQESSTASFTYRYQDLAPHSLALVQSESEKMMAAVNDFFNFTPKEKIPVVIYPTSETLNAHFGWDGDRSPMGVYWMGYINILAPEAWIDGDNRAQSQIFQTMGPMAHEYSHYIVDLQTQGNYPRWFSEGLAQYVEQSQGYFTTEPPQAKTTALYNFADLEKKFDQQSDQSLAYWQSLMAIDYLIATYGQELPTQILAALGQGQPFAIILHDLTGHNNRTLTQAVSTWAKQSTQAPYILLPAG